MHGLPKDCIYTRINPDVVTVSDLKAQLQQKQDRLKELRIENQKYPSDCTERQIAKVQSIIARLQKTIITEQERGKH